MGNISDIDVALSNWKYGGQPDTVNIGSIGVCLEDSGQPVKLYIVDTIYGCGTIEIFPVDQSTDDETPPRVLDISDFWALT